MKNNIIIFHLESVNYNLFLYHNSLFPNINKILNESIFFEHYYSTATSTFMVVSDLLYGTHKNFETSKTLEEIYTIRPKNESLLTELRNNGYQTYCLCYGKKADFGENITINQFNELIDSNTKTILIEDKAILCNEFQKCITDSPFCIYIQNYEAHISEIDTFDNISRQLSEDLLLERYKQLDMTCGLLLEELKKNNNLDNTIVLFYGDHGDELLHHGLHEGLTHAIEPFMSMIHTPLIIYNPDSRIQRYNSNLISTVELKDYILNLLKLKNDAFEYPKLVFSRNLYMGQGLRNGFFNKSYSVTNGKYQLLVSSKGLRLYLNELDMIGSRNILDFFKLHKGKLIYNKIFDSMKSSHFKNFMTLAQQETIISSFYILLIELKKYLADFYGNKSSRMKFDKIQYSTEIKPAIIKYKIRNFICLIKQIIKTIIRYKK